MRRILLVFSFLVSGSMLLLSQAPERPDFSGTWRLEAAGSVEVTTFHQDASRIRIIMRISDSAGKRELEMSGEIDGKPHRQTVLGYGCTLTAQWFGDSLVWEVRRESVQGTLDNRRIMTLSGHDSFHATRTRLAPGPISSWEETWTRVSGE